MIQRAAIHVQSSGRSEVTGANVLVAIFAERESHAAFFLQEQEMTRYDAVNFIAHGVSKNPNYEETKELEDGDQKDAPENSINNPEKFWSKFWDYSKIKGELVLAVSIEKENIEVNDYDKKEILAIIDEVGVKKAYQLVKSKYRISRNDFYKLSINLKNV